MMASNKTARRKFRVPLKEGASLPCSQASSASGLAEVSQERGKESSQSWLSQLTATDEPLSSKHAKFSTDNAAKPIATPKQDLVPTREAVRPKGSIFSLDDSLCSISGVENENFCDSGADSVEQDSLSGNTAVVSPEGEHLCQETQTHTVLSFCSEASTPVVASGLQKELSAAIGKFQVIEYAQDEPMDDIIVDCSDSEDAAMDQGDQKLKDPAMSRFQRKNKPATRKYDYSKILPRFGPRAQRGKNGAGKNISNTKTRTKKRVTLDLVVNQGPGFNFSKSSSSGAVAGVDHQDTVAMGDLSVYDYQPTPQQEEGREGGGEETSELNNSNWISRRTREEQLAVDREVLKIITKTREEIRILRETYAARKASRKNCLQSGTDSSSKYHTGTFKVPQQRFRRSRRAKPSLIMSSREEDYGSSVMQKERYSIPHNCRHKYSTALEKREE